VRRGGDTNRAHTEARDFSMTLSLNSSQRGDREECEERMGAAEAGATGKG
jgi:hypothetical protein